ncbi:unnamed protein product [Prorocentrum cordatum]|uniref:Uncharacterized protein n=1 Tax=Prorocentrum cordatum TaxID=2364126 RepID=A0ABN9X2T2_9DINO|nr:unnamed protein product [Polarella glacialis]
MEVGGGKGASGKGSGVEGGSNTTASAPSSKLSVEEHLQMAALCEKAGDLHGARGYRTAAQALQAPEQHQVPLQSQLNRAHQQARAVEKKLNSAVDRFEQLEQQQLAAQKSHVLQFRADLEAAEAEHSGLVRQLHNQLQDGQSQSAVAPGNKLSLEDLLGEQRFSAAFDLGVGDCFKIVEDEESLSPDELQQLSARVDLFKTGIADMAKNLFAEAKAKVDELKAEHKQLAARMAAKKRLTGGYFDGYYTDCIGSDGGVVYPIKAECDGEG